jgi:hypothetical protein
VQETINFSGTIIGEGQRLECQVRATKTTLLATHHWFLITGLWNLRETEQDDPTLESKDNLSRIKLTGEHQILFARVTDVMRSVIFAATK